MELYTSFQSLLNAGDKSSELYQSPLESLADTMLFFPRAVWRERNIHIFLGDFPSRNRKVFFETKSQEEINRNSINSSLWLFASALAITLLVPGLLLKEFALWTNKSANLYHQMIKVVEREIPSHADTKRDDEMEKKLNQRELILKFLQEKDEREVAKKAALDKINEIFEDNITLFSLNYDK